MYAIAYTPFLCFVLHHRLAQDDLFVVDINGVFILQTCQSGLDTIGDQLLTNNIIEVISPFAMAEEGVNPKDVLGDETGKLYIV